MHITHEMNMHNCQLCRKEWLGRCFGKKYGKDVSVDNEPCKCYEFGGSEERLKEIENNMKWGFTRKGNIMNNGIYHIKDNKIYKMSIDKPEEQIGVVASIEDRNNIIDDFANNLINKIELKYCNGNLTSQYIGMQTCDWIREIAEAMKRWFTGMHE